MATTLEGLDELAWMFMRDFARMECALKAVGYLLARRRNQAPDDQPDAIPDWDRFALELEAQQVFARDLPAAVSDAVDFLLRTPPKTQSVTTLADGSRVVDWKDTRQKDELAANLIQLVRVVRNNLFHGGKFNNHWFDPFRSERLILHSLVILEHVRARHDAIGDAYRGVLGVFPDPVRHDVAASGVARERD